MSPTDPTKNPPTIPINYQSELLKDMTEAVESWFDDDYDNYGFDKFGETTDRNFGQ